MAQKVFQRIRSLFFLGLLVIMGLAGCGTGTPDLERSETPAGVLSIATVAAVPGRPGDPFVVSDAPTLTSSPPIIVTVGNEAQTVSTPIVSPPMQFSEPVVFEYGPRDRPEIALTFDAGADRGNTEEILDLLKEYGAAATFGVTGQWVSENPDLINRIVADGHMIINHTWTHRSFTGFSTNVDDAVLTAADRQDEIVRTANAIAQLTGYQTTPYFRPPYGDYDASVIDDLAEIGYFVTVMWTCDTLGWDGATVEQIVARCGTEVTGGEIILLHVQENSLDAAALPMMLDAYQSAGFDFVTIAEMIDS